jgi:hypothetical protein
MLVHNLEKPIPCKQNIKSPVPKANPRSKLVRKADGKKNNEEIDIGFLSAVKKMQLEDDYDMLDSDDDVLSLDDDEEVSITGADIRRTPVEQDNRINVSKLNGDKPTQETIQCLASTAELLRPKKRTKVEELLTVTIAYMKNKRPDQAREKQKLRVLFDSGCGATLVNKRFVRHWKKTESKATKWSTKRVVALKPKGNVKSSSHYQPSMKTETLLAMPM